MTPLHIASLEKHINLAIVLIENEAQINAKNKDQVENCHTIL